MTVIIVFVKCYSVVTIRTIISKQGLSKRVNYKMFLINAGAFAFYELASIIWCFYLIHYTKEHSENLFQSPLYFYQEEKIALIAWLVAFSSLFFAQLCLIYIFNGFVKKE